MRSLVCRPWEARDALTGQPFGGWMVTAASDHLKQFHRRGRSRWRRKGVVVLSGPVRPQWHALGGYTDDQRWAFSHLADDAGDRQHDSSRLVPRRLAVSLADPPAVG